MQNDFPSQIDLRNPKVIFKRHKSSTKCSLEFPQNYFSNQYWQNSISKFAISMLISTQLSHIHKCERKKAEFTIKIIDNKGSRVFQEELSHDFDLTYRLF